MPLPFNNNQRLLFIGDSITDCGRQRPVGARDGDGLGTGYVSFIDSILAATVPESVVQIMNLGISGNRVTDLQARWQTDVLDLKPNWLSVMIGINDVWRQFDAIDRVEQIDPEYFESVYRRILESTRPKLDGLIIMSPFMLETDRADTMRARMDEYAAITAEIAGAFDAVFVDVQAAFSQYLCHQPAETLAEDRIHPNSVGHMIIAQAFLEQLSLA